MLVELRLAVGFVSCGGGKEEQHVSSGLLFRVQGLGVSRGFGGLHAVCCAFMQLQRGQKIPPPPKKIQNKKYQKNTRLQPLRLLVFLILPDT